MATYALIFFIFLAAGFIQGMAGFGSALVAIPLLSLFIDIKAAIPLCTLHGLLITGFLSLHLKDHMDRKKILPLLLGSLPGIVAGVIFLKRADPGLMKTLMGGMIFFYGLYRLAGRPQPRKMHRRWSYVAGFATGAIGSAFSAGGPPAIIYTTLTGWHKDEIKATLSGFFFAGSLLIAAAHAINGLTTSAVLRYFGISAPGVFMGVIMGSALYDRMHTESYLNLLFYILMALGIMMIQTTV